MSYHGSVAKGFLFHWRWIWQLVGRKGLAIGLRFSGKGSNSYNVLGSSEVAGQNVIGDVGPRTIW